VVPRKLTTEAQLRDYSNTGPRAPLAFRTFIFFFLLPYIVFSFPPFLFLHRLCSDLVLTVVCWGAAAGSERTQSALRAHHR
jgi:hypothetical protein